MVDISEYRGIFLEELEEQLQLIEDEILRLEQTGETEAGIQRFFRAAHTLKGSSASMGYNKLKEVTHHLEHLLHQMRNGERQVTQELIRLFFQTLDGMRALQGEIAAADHETTDVSGLIRKLGSYGAGGQGSIPVMQLPSGEDAPLPLLWFHVWLSPDCEMKLPRLHLIDAKLRSLSTVLRMKPELEEMDINDSRLDGASWMLAPEGDIHGLRRHIASMIDVENIYIEEVKDTAPQRTKVRLAEPETDNRADREHFEAAPFAADKVKPPTIRVHVERLEKLMNLAGELVIDQAQLHLLSRRFHQKYGADSMTEELGQLADHLVTVTRELQESMIKVRMLPIEQLFNRLPRMVRDLSHSLNKQIGLVIEGKETELDRTLIEELGDPLIHLLRNALDHGIETPELRRAAGKSETGTVRIAASHEDNQIILVIEDDGAGIDPEAVAQSAISKGIITAEEARYMNEDEALRLIFRPGFSTATQISDISGRGVGMDIVRNDIERINGIIDIETAKGQGTRFRIRLPLTLAIIRGLLVIAGNKTFVIPMSNVAEILRIPAEDIRSVRGRPVITARSQLVPVVWLHHFLQIPRAEAAPNTLPLIILGQGEKRLALAVDALVGNQDIVIKPLGSYIGKTEGIAGATILGNGKAALIIDTASLFAQWSYMV
ncbi:chemotaxis protein CheA [Paenibacillus sp. S150]|uniref:chemotaxis protein CheA n=1 Tax=Paenibacillus sp. S150 TaxID=2749826 RepID=UPI001C562B71|nr:chemotaxis protein CheA [Paenibacillus sp. S150]MBW4084244.1 chemotaxis protein CheA [Paenibacillus sp. S150]